MRTLHMWMSHRFDTDGLPRTIINKYYAEPIDWNGQMYHRKFYYHGHSIGRWYDFDVVRCEL